MLTTKTNWIFMDEQNRQRVYVLQDNLFNVDADFDLRFESIFIVFDSRSLSSHTTKTFFIPQSKKISSKLQSMSAVNNVNKWSTSELSSVYPYSDQFVWFILHMQFCICVSTISASIFMVRFDLFWEPIGSNENRDQIWFSSIFDLLFVCLRNFEYFFYLPAKSIWFWLNEERLCKT